jgi:hypothetical protein
MRYKFQELEVVLEGHQLTKVAVLIWLFNWQKN